ncbi:hypothetical protein LHU07_000363 [Clostridioides difficile]|nr:hypothetical protein [Clostridioides difficile]MCW0724904.1 hypothetical protein [Clostridioides difficile]
MSLIKYRGYDFENEKWIYSNTIKWSDAECSCCIYANEDDCYPTSCVTGCEKWLDMEVEL